jgi:hypothetical protein
MMVVTPRRGTDMQLEILGYKERVGRHRRVYRMRCDEEAADRIEFLVNESINLRIGPTQLRENLRELGFPRQWDADRDGFYITYIPTMATQVVSAGVPT